MYRRDVLKTAGVGGFLGWLNAGDVRPLPNPRPQEEAQPQEEVKMPSLYVLVREGKRTRFFASDGQELAHLRHFEYNGDIDDVCPASFIVGEPFDAQHWYNTPRAQLCVEKGRVIRGDNGAPFDAKIIGMIDFFGPVWRLSCKAKIVFSDEELPFKYEA